MAIQSNAWVASFLFSKWIVDFIQIVMKSQEGEIPTQRHFMILDSYNSHVTLDVCVKAKKVSLDIFSLPLHTLHAFQLQDMAVFKPFRIDFCKEHKGMVVRKGDLTHWVS